MERAKEIVEVKNIAQIIYKKYCLQICNKRILFKKDFKEFYNMTILEMLQKKVRSSKRIVKR